MSQTIEIALPELHSGRDGRSGQQQVLDECARFNVLECGRRFGKTTLGEVLDVLPALEGWPTAWFAPTHKFMAEVWDWFVATLKPVTAKVNSQEKRLQLITGGVIDFWSLEDPNAGRGRKYKRVVIDEAALVRSLKKCWQASIRPTLTDYQGDAWFLSTPQGYSDFHQLFLLGETDPNWKSWRKGSIENPYLSDAEVESARADLPPHIFRQEYEGIPDEDAGNPFGLSHIQACIGPLSDDEPNVWGWDLAKSVDYTVGIALDKMGRVCRFVRFQKPWRETLLTIRQETGKTYALVDSTGVGDPIVEELANGPGAYVGFKFNPSSKQQIFEGLAMAIQRELVEFPDGPIRSELESFRYEYRPGGGVRYSAPEGMHDDCPCALALAWEAHSGNVGEAIVLKPRAPQSKDEAERRELARLMLGDEGAKVLEKADRDRHRPEPPVRVKVISRPVVSKW